MLEASDFTVLTLDLLATIIHLLGQLIAPTLGLAQLLFQSRHFLLKCGFTLAQSQDLFGLIFNEKDLSFLRGALPFPEEGKTGPGKAHPLILGVARQQRH